MSMLGWEAGPFHLSMIQLIAEPKRAFEPVPQTRHALAILPGGRSPTSEPSPCPAPIMYARPNPSLTMSHIDESADPIRPGIPVTIPHRVERCLDAVPRPVPGPPRCARSLPGTHPGDRQDHSTSRRPRTVSHARENLLDRAPCLAPLAGRDRLDEVEHPGEHVEDPAECGLDAFPHTEGGADDDVAELVPERTTSTTVLTMACTAPNAPRTSPELVGPSRFVYCSSAADVVGALIEQTDDEIPRRAEASKRAEPSPKWW